MLFLSALCYDLVDESDDSLVNIMSLVDSLDHLGFGDLVGSGLDHDNLLLGGCNGKLKISACPLLLRRVDNEFAVYHSHLSHRARSVKGDV